MARARKIHGKIHVLTHKPQTANTYKISFWINPNPAVDRLQPLFNPLASRLLLYPDTPWLPPLLQQLRSTRATAARIPSSSKMFVSAFLPLPLHLEGGAKTRRKEKANILFFTLLEYRPRSVTPSSRSRESTRHNGRRERFSKSTLRLLQRSPRAR